MPGAGESKRYGSALNELRLGSVGGKVAVLGMNVIIK